MKIHPVSPDGNTKIVHGSELVLIGFAVLLLAAAVEPEFNSESAIPVKVNLPMPAQPDVILNTAMVEIPTKLHDTSTQTTALLDNSQGTMSVALP